MQARRHGLAEPRDRLVQGAARQHGGEVLAVGRRRVDVLDRLDGAAALAGLANQVRRRHLADERLLDLACAHRQARRAAGCTAAPPIVTEARVIRPAPSASSSAAADVIAKSPWRRANSTNAKPWPAGHGV